MWTFKQITLRNFMSFKLETFIFEKGKVYLLTGVNLTDPGQENNGSGKSAFLEAIVYCLLGDTIRKVSYKDLLRKGETEGDVKAILSHPLKGELSVTRTISKSKSASISILENGVKPKQDITSADSGTKHVLSLLGLGKEDLLNYFFLSKKTYKSFFESGDADKKRVIGRFSRADTVDIALKEIELRINELEGISKTQSLELARIEERVRIYTQQKADSLLGSKDKILKYTQTIDELTTTLSQKRLDRENQENLLNIEKLKLDKFTELTQFRAKLQLKREEVIPLNQKITKIKTNISETWKILNSFRGILVGQINCPKCAHPFSTLDPTKDILKLRESEKTAQGLYDEFIAEEKSASEELNTLNIQINSIDQAIRNLEREEGQVKKQVVSIEHSINMSKVSEESLVQNIDHYQALLKNSLDNKEEEELGKKLSLQIDQANIDLEQKTKDISSNLELLKDRNEIYQTFIRFKTHLSNKAIGSIEFMTNKYLDLTKSNIKVQVDGYKQNADGKIAEKIEVQITKGGILWGISASLSGGEFVRVDICCLMAMQKLINSASPSGGLDFLWLDEVVESVDGSGLKGLLNSLSDLAQTIIVVTHVAFNHPFKNIIKVVKENEISTLHA